MHILLKFLLKTISEKKFRTIVIIISIAFSSAILFGSITLRNSLYCMHVEQIKSVIGNADFMVVAKRESPDYYFNINKGELNDPEFEYAIGAVEETALLSIGNDSEKVNLKGFNLEDIQKMNPFSFKERDDQNAFEGNKVIISSNFSRKHNLKTRDTIRLKLKEKIYFFKVYGISDDEGVFLQESDSAIMIIPRDTLSAICGFYRMASVYYIKVFDNVDKTQAFNRISQCFSRLDVIPILPDEDMENYIKRTTSSFLQVSIIVIFLSLFIIYTTFKILSVEKLPVLGTLISVGATRKTIRLLVFLEVFLYGFIGGALGCILGVGVLKGIVSVIKPPYLSGNTSHISQYGPLDFLITFTVANLIVFLGALVPMIKVSKLPVKEILFNTEKGIRTGYTLKRSVIGIILIVLSSVMLKIEINRFEAFLYISSALMLLAAFIILVPDIVRLFVKTFETLNSVIPVNEIIISVSNIKYNKNMIVNITLLTVGISVLIMINTLSSGVVQAVSSMYGNKNFDIQISVSNADRNTEAMIRHMEGVKSVYGVYEDRYIEVVGTKQRIRLIQGIDGEEFFDYLDVAISGNKVELLKELRKGRSIILSNVLRDSLKVKKGDYITLDMRRDKKAYKVIGFMDSIDNFGSYALIWYTYLKADTLENNYSRLFVKTTEDPFIVRDTIKSYLRQRENSVSIIKELMKDDIESNKSNFLLMKFFCYISMIVGAIGIANNFVLSFIERRHTLAIFRSLGMSRMQSIMVLFLESIIGGLIGGLTGVIAGAGLMTIIPYILKLYGVPVSIGLGIQDVIIYVFIGIALSLFASAIPIIMVSKMRILQTLRYE